MLNPLLDVEGLGKSYGCKVVFSGLSLRAGQGENLLLTGPSGCGKSTLLRLLAGLEAAENGSIRIAGQLVSTADNILVPPAERGIGMVFQDLGLWPNLSALENVAVGLSRLKVSRPERVERARQALEACEILPLADRRPHSLSGGELQRVALARAVAGRPRLLLLDEPFNALDLVLKAALMQRICDLAGQSAMTVIMASHYPADAILLHAKVAVLENGSIGELGAFGTLCINPVSQTMRAWRQAMPDTPR